MSVVPGQFALFVYATKSGNIIIKSQQAEVCVGPNDLKELIAALQQLLRKQRGE